MLRNEEGQGIRKGEWTTPDRGGSAVASGIGVLPIAEQFDTVRPTGRPNHETIVLDGELEELGCRRLVAGIETARAYFSPKLDIPTTKGILRINRPYSRPHSRIMRPIVQQLSAQARDEGQVQSRHQQSTIAQGHAEAAPARNWDSSRRRARSSAQPPARKRIPPSIRLAERPSRSITAEK